MDDSDRFILALSRITGKWLTYEHLTGKDGWDKQRAFFVVMLVRVKSDPRLKTDRTRGP